MFNKRCFWKKNGPNQLRGIQENNFMVDNHNTENQKWFASPWTAEASEC